MGKKVYIITSNVAKSSELEKAMKDAVKDEIYANLNRDVVFLENSAVESDDTFTKLAKSLKTLQNSDLVVFTENWEKSQNSLIHIAMAVECGIERYYSAITYNTILPENLYSDIKTFFGVGGDFANVFNKWGLI